MGVGASSLNSKIVPSVVAEIGRRNIDTLVEYMGDPCNLYKVVSVTNDDALADKQTIVYSDMPIRTKVRILWSPEVKLLKMLGLFTEDTKPILAYFKFEDDPVQDEYIELDIEYHVDGTIKTNKFKIVDRKFIGYGVEQKAVWVIAPMRR